MSSSAEVAPGSFAEWLRINRNARNATQREVAEATDLDLTLLCRIESGERMPTEDQADLLARFFKANLKETHALRIADQFRRKYARHPAMHRAIVRLAEEQGLYRVRRKVDRE